MIQKYFGFAAVAIKRDFVHLKNHPSNFRAEYPSQVDEGKDVARKN
jgi:hypothetical protein